ncbi:hypothetical protein MMC08_002025 [Hypocenomyce scalaris]|nr:hypothetical protein [Hypocenomyce scalaris]
MTTNGETTNGIHSNGETINGDMMNGTKATSKKLTKPSKLAHVVLKTSNYRAMVEWYKAFLGAEITHEGDTLTFLRYDDEHHRVAIIRNPDAGPKDLTAAGVHHVAFSYDTLDDLVGVYTQCKEQGIKPYWCTNHGPTTSIYYRDLDNNLMETQVDNFDTVEEANDYMASRYFGENPVGVDFDPEDLINRLRAGEDHRAIKKRPEIGPRTLPGEV